MMGATSAAIVTDVFPAEKRGKALGINSLAVYTGLAVGPTLGGVLVQALGWRSIFYINVPIGIAVSLTAVTRLEESAEHGTPNGHFDVLGQHRSQAGFPLFTLGLFDGCRHSFRGCYHFNSAGEQEKRMDVCRIRI